MVLNCTVLYFFHIGTKLLYVVQHTTAKNLQCPVLEERLEILMQFSTSLSDWRLYYNTSTHIHVKFTDHFVVRTVCVSVGTTISNQMTSDLDMKHGGYDDPI